MSAEPRLFRRAGRWTFRVRVPEDLRAAIGKRELWRALGDVSAVEARRLARVESVAADALFAKARTALRDGPADLRPSDAALADFARRHLAELERDATPIPFNEDERLARVEEAQTAALDIGQTIADGHLQARARRAARDAGLPIAPVLDAAHAAALREAAAGSGPIVPKTRRQPIPVQPVAIPATANVDLLRVTEAVQRALVEHFGREADRASLLPERVGDPLFASVNRNTPTVPLLNGNVMSPLALGRAVDAYLGDVSRAHLSPASRASYAAKLAVVVEILGAGRPVAEITRADIREARDVILRLPPNASKRWPGVPLRQMAERAARDGISPVAPKTALLHIDMLSSLFRWLVKEEMAPRNPAVGIEGPAVPDETERRPFTTAELNALFASPRFDGPAGRGWMWWLPRLALYSGARFAELIGLKAADLIEVEGVRCLSIEPNDVRPLKTKGSRRIVPIHPAIAALGLAEYATAQPAGGLLFRDAAGPKDMIRAQNKAMGRAIREVISDDDVVFHSLRHTFKDAADAVMPREIVARLGGWEPPGGRGAIDSYGRATLAQKLSEELAKLSFPGLRL